MKKTLTSNLTNQLYLKICLNINLFLCKFFWILLYINEDSYWSKGTFWLGYELYTPIDDGIVSEVKQMNNAVAELEDDFEENLKYDVEECLKFPYPLSGKNCQQILFFLQKMWTQNIEFPLNWT